MESSCRRVEELARDLEVDVRLEQDATDLPQALPDHGLVEDAALPQLLERAVELAGQFVEQTVLPPPKSRGPKAKEEPCGINFALQSSL
jgi:hypothetical protein